MLLHAPVQCSYLSMRRGFCEMTSEDTWRETELRTKETRTVPADEVDARTKSCIVMVYNEI